MTLIKCPECGHDVSSQAPSCPNCGYVFNLAASVQDSSHTDSEEVAEPKATEAATDTPASSSVEEHISTEQDPVESATAIATPTAENKPGKKKGKKKLALIIGIIVAVIIVIVGISAYSSYQKQQAELQRIAAHDEYVDNLKTASKDMISGLSDAESACNLIQQVWRNAIFEKDQSKWPENLQPYFATDFNDALGKLFASDEYKGYTKKIYANEDTVESDMKSLTNPPDDCQEAYETLKDLYTDYNKFTSLATSPTGSLQDFNSDFNQLDKDALSKFQMLQTQIPDKQGSDSK